MWPLANWSEKQDVLLKDLLVFLSFFSPNDLKNALFFLFPTVVPRMKIQGEIGSGKHEITIIIHKQTLSGVSAVDIKMAGRELARIQVFM